MGRKRPVNRGEMGSDNGNEMRQTLLRRSPASVQLFLDTTPPTTSLDSDPCSIRVSSVFHPWLKDLLLRYFQGRVFDRWRRNKPEPAFRISSPSPRFGRSQLSFKSEAYGQGTSGSSISLRKRPKDQELGGVIGGTSSPRSNTFQNHGIDSRPTSDPRAFSAIACVRSPVRRQKSLIPSWTSLESEHLTSLNSISIDASRDVANPKFQGRN